MTGRKVLPVAIALLLAAPFFVFEWIPLYDLPNHIARQHILFGDGAPGAEAYYAINWRPIPNLALEAVVFALHRVMPVEAAVRLFLAATAAQLFLGTILLRRAVFGRVGGLELGAALFVFGGPLLAGFVNECFGVGMALWVFALWIKWRRRHAMAPGFALLASLILVAHLFGFAIYALLVGAFCVGETISARTLVLTSIAQAAHLALPLALLALAPGGTWSLPVYDFGREKIAALGWAVGGFDPVPDALLFAAVLLGLLALTRRIVVAPPMVAPLAALGAAFILLPRQIGDATFIDFRIPPIFMLVLAASVDWRRPDDRWRHGTDTITMAIFLVRFAGLMLQWSSWQPIYAQFRAALELVPQGARLMPVGVRTDIIAASDRPPLGHIAALAVTLRGAFIPTLFANGPHDLLTYRQPWMDGNADYLLLKRPERLDLTELPPHELVAHGDDFSLVRVIR